MKNIFDKKVSDEMINRINLLDSSTNPKWGKMTVDQMLAHCSVAYEMTFSDKHRKPNAFAKFLLKIFVKKAVVGAKPYPKNGRTAPQFIIIDSREFDKEKEILIAYIQKTQSLGEAYFQNKESHSFGKMNASEWSTMFYKHLDHHLSQFGV